MTSYKDGFESVYEKSIKNPDNKLIKMSYPVDDQQASRIKKDTGLDVVGYNRTIDNYSIRHILGGHDNQKREATRGQLPITKDDFLRIPEIVSSADSISNAGKTDIGRDTILYKKKINGHVYYVEEVRTKHNELNPVSMWKVKSSTTDAPPVKESPTQTSETFRVPSPSTGSTISQTAEPVKKPTIHEQLNNLKAKQPEGETPKHPVDEAGIVNMHMGIPIDFKKILKSLGKEKDPELERRNKKALDIFEPMGHEWIGNRQLAEFFNGQNAEKIQKQISDLAGEKNYGPKSQAVAALLHLLLDTLRDPTALHYTYPRLNPEDQALAHQMRQAEQDPRFIAKRWGHAFGWQSRQYHRL